ncbi:hypothetical protein [Bradyrhizobium sp. LB13.1]
MHKRLAFIDTLRGIAVLAVLFQHVLEVIVQKHPTGAYYWVFHDAIGLLHELRPVRCRAVLLRQRFRHPVQFSE